MLRFLESYVLHCVGLLDATTRRQLEEMTPQLEATLGITGAWHEIVAAAMQFPADLPDRIRSLWADNCRHPEQQGRLSPEQFAVVLVDENFS